MLHVPAAHRWLTVTPTVPQPTTGMQSCAASLPSACFQFLCRTRGCSPGTVRENKVVPRKFVAAGSFCDVFLCYGLLKTSRCGTKCCREACSTRTQLESAFLRLVCFGELRSKFEPYGFVFVTPTKKGKNKNVKKKKKKNTENVTPPDNA